ncbi:ankyrin repeat-containing domain protein [Gloeopeniophorella convolvens]|nr:ankyrin repeat-containing domain protein [Gloeopeniophorella convolvens]
MPVSTRVEKNIWVAAGDGDLDRVRELIQPISPNAPDPFTYTPMHAAASYGHLDILTYLISEGGNVNITDEDGDTPLYTVENVETAQFLINNGADAAWRNHEGLSPAEHLAEDFLEVAAYLNTVNGIQTPSPGDGLAGNHSELGPAAQPSQHSQEAVSELLTSSLLNQLRDIVQREQDGGSESRREEELRQAVSNTVLEGMVTGYSMANQEGDPETRDSDVRHGDADVTKRRRLDEPDGPL